MMTLHLFVLAGNHAESGADLLQNAVIEELPKLAGSILLLLLLWFVGQRLTVAWNIRQKQREIDLDTARSFHALYGEFFAVWKLWNYYRRDVGAAALPTASRWALLERACLAEGRLEAMFVHLACQRPLTPPAIESLGRFRQLYQTMRQVIRDDRPLEWNHSEHPDYLLFKNLAPRVEALLLDRPMAPEAPATLRAITANRWETRSAQMSSS